MLPSFDSSKMSKTLDYHHIDQETLSMAIAELNRIASDHAPLMRKHEALAGALLHYENLLVDAQAGDANALKCATEPKEFDKVLDMAEDHNHADEIEILAFREDLLKYKSSFLSTGSAE